MKRSVKSMVVAANSSSGSSKESKRIKTAVAVTAFVPPADWKDVYRVLKRLRTEFGAPVDEFGPHRLFNATMDRDAQRYQILCALQLSSQTRDQITAQAMQRLNDSGLTASPSVMKNAKAEELEKLMYPVGFYRKKSVSLIQTAIILDRDFGGKVPHDLDALLSLPGIGPKMAHLALHHAFDDIRGIGVDTHVHRITNQLHWAKSQDPEQTREQLESWLPREEWGHINYILVGVGQGVQQPEYRAKMLSALEKWNDEDEDTILVRKTLKRLGLGL